MEQSNQINLKQTNQEKENRSNAKGEQSHSELWAPTCNLFFTHQEQKCTQMQNAVLSVCTVEEDYGLLVGRRNKGMHSNATILISNCKIWTPCWAKLQVSLTKAVCKPSHSNMDNLITVAALYGILNLLFGISVRTFKTSDHRQTRGFPAPALPCWGVGLSIGRICSKGHGPQAPLIDFALFCVTVIGNSLGNQKSNWMDSGAPEKKNVTLKHCVH